jgi:ABC-type sugar transport system ATPase subunit
VSAPLLEIHSIHKSFPGVKVLEDVSFDVSAGEVHALMGENGAGKSTLMKILMGIYSSDKGSLRVEGQDFKPSSPRDALDYGVSMIHQELNPILDLTVYENIYLGREIRTKSGLYDKKSMRRATQNLLDELGLNIDASQMMRSLSVAQMQLVEIAKAISVRSRVIIMDEPTSAITETDVTTLFKQVRALRDSGVGIIYISHKMDEIFEIADSITVLRDGKVIMTKPASTLTNTTLISAMVGRQLAESFPKRQVSIGDPILRVDGWSSPPMVEDVSLTLHRGEVLGIGGLIGAGRSEFVESLFGIRTGSGRQPIKLKSSSVTFKHPKDAIEHGVALVTEDRKITGLNLHGSVQDNITLPSLRKLFPKGLVRAKKERSVSDDFIEKLKIRTPSSRQEVSKLSGGNQQKVVLAKWLLTNPEIIIFDEPTRGIDIGAKHDIYVLIGDLVEAGKSVIVISSEMSELMGLSDRILVFAEGRVTGTLSRDEFSQERILTLASNFESTSDELSN